MPATVTAKAPGECDVVASAGGRQGTCHVTVQASKNLLRYWPLTANGMTAEINPDGSLKLSGKATKLYVGLSWRLPDSLAGKTVAFSVQGAPSGYGVQIFAQASGGDPMYIRAGESGTLPAGANVYLNILSGTEGYGDATAASVKAQLEEGTAATAWERPDQTGWVATQAQQAQADEAMQQAGQAMQDLELS